ncbi:PAS domain S-box protein [Pseudoalteromonas phenolica]|uniref:PAS domain S-box protein n=1 Tax=Pseudoalteromonas phenolica TaxID=161398 RepID=UPI0013EE5155
MRRGQSIINEEVTFDDSQQLVSTTDLRGVTTYANAAFCAVSGFSAEELVGKTTILYAIPICQKRRLKSFGIN